MFTFLSKMNVSSLGNFSSALEINLLSIDGTLDKFKYVKLGQPSTKDLMSTSYIIFLVFVNTNFYSFGSFIVLKSFEKSMCESSV